MPLDPSGRRFAQGDRRPEARPPLQRPALTTTWTPR